MKNKVYLGDRKILLSLSGWIDIATKTIILLDRETGIRDRTGIQGEWEFKEEWGFKEEREFKGNGNSRKNGNSTKNGNLRKKRTVYKNCSLGKDKNRSIYFIEDFRVLISISIVQALSSGFSGFSIFVIISLSFRAWRCFV